MTETHSLGDWEQRFDNTFDLDDYGESNIVQEKVKDFIRSLLLAQKEGFRREIEGLKWKEPSFAGDFDWTAKMVKIYSLTLDEALTKLDTNGI